MTAAVAILGIALVGGLAVPAAAWEPTKPVEFVVPAGTGGGADQMARLIASVVSKHNLMPRSTPLVVVNKAGGAGETPRTRVVAALPECRRALVFLDGPVRTDRVEVERHESGESVAQATIHLHFERVRFRLADGQVGICQIRERAERT
jgi:hypothetical protein